MNRHAIDGQQHKVPGFPTTDLKPAIVITPGAGRWTLTQETATESDKPFVPERIYGAMHQALRDEWPLAAFTFMVSILVGLLSKSVFTAQPPSLTVFVGISVLAGLVSTVHLGKKTRGWRAILNPRSSWLSREVSLFGAFVVFGTAHLSFAPGNKPIAWSILAIGFATLFSVDRVYATLPLIDTRKYHSASTILTGLFFIGVFSWNPMVAGVVGGGKFLLYNQRKIQFRKLGKPARPILSACRVVAGFLVPALAWIFAGIEVSPLIITAVLVGEVTDRLEFYAELDLLTPDKQMTIDLREAISS